jgi:AraC-like DNA-binding protein
MTKDKLACLPFGNQGAISNTQVESLCATLSLAVPGNFDIGIIGPGATFRHKTCVIRTGNLAVAATATTPISVRRHEVPYATLRIPISGSCTYKLPKGRCVERPGRTAVLLSGAAREAETCGVYAGAHVAIDSDRLQATAQAMAGSHSQVNAGTFELDRDREINLQQGPLCFDAVFRAHFSLLDAFVVQPATLALQAVDDLLYRSLVMLLYPAILNPDESSPGLAQSAERRTLNALCDYIKAHIDEPITLTRLEQISGFSRRSLQYAFLRHFACTPMQWLRERRLELAHTLLTRPDPNTSITQVALTCGFPISGLFSQYYAARYGEKPSATLARCRC